MAFGVIQLNPGGRRYIGAVLSCLCLVQFVAGIVIVGYGSYFIRNLQWKLSIISSYDSRTLNVLTIALGSIISVAHLCGAKMLYDSGKETTRHRFESFLFLLVLIFTCLLAMEFAVAITCKIHLSWFDEIFENEKGFIKAIKEYGKNTDLRVRMDRLQFEDQCCGAENFSDWLSEDWVSPRFSPLSNPNLTPEQKSLYYPWKMRPLSGPIEQPELWTETAQAIPPPEQYQPTFLIPVNPIPHEQNYGTGYGPSPEDYIAYSPPVDISSLDGFERRPRRAKRYPKEGRAHLSKIIDDELSKRSQLEDSAEQGNVNMLPEEQGHLSVVPWSCCSTDYLGPCIHDYVTQYDMVNLLRVKVSWNGTSLYQRGCWLLLKNEYISFMCSYMVLFWVTVIIQVLVVLPARYLQTGVENLKLYNRDDNSAPGYLWGETSMSALRKAKKYQNTRVNDGTTNEDIKDLEEVSLLEEYDRLKEKQKKRQKLRQLLLKSKIPSQEESELSFDDKEESTLQQQQSGRKRKLKGTRNASEKLFSDFISIDTGEKLYQGESRKKMKSTMHYLPDEVKHVKSQITKHRASLLPENESEV